MNLMQKTLRPKMLVFILSFMTFLSCSKDNDLFLDAIIEPENPTTVTPTPTDSTDTETPPVENPVEEEVDPIGTPVDNTVNIDFNFEAGNNIPLIPANPNRTIYIAVNGKASNSGLTQDSPKDIASAFDKSFVQAGDLFYIKAGDYKFDFNPSNGRQFDLSNLPSSASRPIYWIGYKNTPGDINATEFSTVSWEDYKARPQAADRTHSLDSSVMPTFSGNTSRAPQYIGNESLFWQDGGEQGFVFRNIQIQYFRYGFQFKNLSSSVFENVIIANLGNFEPVEGQGGSNQDLIGKGFSITQKSDRNVIKNSATYNMAMIGFSLGEGEHSLIEYCEATSDIDNGNPQDYYFHTTGKYNLFSHVRANRLISSNHSGHGICFNQLADNNVMESSKVYGTSIHFDGAVNCYATNIEIIGDNSYGLYKGGDIIIMDGAENNLIENTTSINGESGISFSDSGKNSYAEHAGKNNTFRNVTVSNKSLAIIDLNWWNEKDDLSENNAFENCKFSNAPYLFVISRSNSNFSFDNCEFTDVNKLQQTSYKNSGNFVLNANTKFTNSTFSNSEIPNKLDFIISNLLGN